jgi:hypothetical protein
MKRNKSILRRLLPWLIGIAALAALVLFVFVPIYSPREVNFGRESHVVNYNGDGKPIVLENDALKFEMDGGTSQFTVTNKANGQIWYSNPTDAENDPIAGGVNKEFLSSTVTITYTNSGGENELNNYRYSIVNQNYQITQPDDSSVRVDYAIGKIERQYMIPTAITEENYKEITGRMSKGDKKKVSTYYTMMTPDKLEKAENKEELLATYPTLATESLYLLKSGTEPKNKEKIEGYFKNAEYTQEEFERDEQNVTSKTVNNGPIFNVTVIYRLEGNDLVVEVPYSELTFEADYPLSYVSVLPMFGAAGTDQEGFILIPEGSGGIIRYNNGKLSQSSYFANFYGWDYGNERTEAVSETENAFSVFGMSRDEGSFICMIEGASSYGAIAADVAQRFNSYNFAYSKYNVIHNGRFKLSGRTDKLVLMYENEIPDDTIVQRYRFLNESSYVRMAEAYGDYLRSKPEFKQDKADSDVPVHVELIGAINKTVPKLGMPVDSVIATTTFEQARAILQELTDEDVRNLHLRMTGWCNGGVRQEVLSGIHTLGQLGGDNGMKKLMEDAAEKNVDLYFDGISCFAYHSGLFQGFIPFIHAAKFTTRELVKLYHYDIVTYQQADWDDPFYLIKPAVAAGYTDRLIDELSRRGVTGVAFRDLGNLLSADYDNKDTVTREQVKAQHVEALRKAQEKGLKISIKEGNDYALPYADMVTDINLSGNGYAIIDESIPFFEIAIHGMKNYTGEPINLAGDYQTSLLECAEYGAGLNFSLMKADTSILQDSAYSCYTGAAWDLWKDSLIPMIRRYQTEMSGLNSQRITGHQKLSAEAAVTEYEDGTRVYVNYGHTDFTGGGKTIPARDYLVERGKAQ